MEKKKHPQWNRTECKEDSTGAPAMTTSSPWQLLCSTTNPSRARPQRRNVYTAELNYRYGILNRVLVAI